MMMMMMMMRKNIIRDSQLLYHKNLENIHYNDFIKFLFLPPKSLAIVIAHCIKRCESCQQKCDPDLS